MRRRPITQHSDLKVFKVFKVLNDFKDPKVIKVVPPKKNTPYGRL